MKQIYGTPIGFAIAFDQHLYVGINEYGTYVSTRAGDEIPIHLFSDEEIANTEKDKLEKKFGQSMKVVGAFIEYSKT